MWLAQRSAGLYSFIQGARRLIPSQCLSSLHSQRVRTICISKGSRSGLDLLLDREWLLDRPDTRVRFPSKSRNALRKSWLLQCKRVAVEGGSFTLLQDDLLHPIMGGNKMRKLDALVPALHAQGYTDVVTCGGVQSAHTAAVAAACAERGLRAHLLVRGERPGIVTGYHLYTRMFGQVTYVARSEYADRRGMMTRHHHQICDANPDAKVFMLAEGAADPLALLGSIRLMCHLADTLAFPTDRECSVVVDSGTGTTAVGLALGMALLQLPWVVVGVMLAGTPSYYAQQQNDLTAAFCSRFGDDLPGLRDSLPLRWVERAVPRSFGKVLPGEVEACTRVAKQQGVLIDPIYTLAAWETAALLAKCAGPGQGRGGGNSGSVATTVGMLHTGGASGLHGLAQRFPHQF